MVFGDDTLVLVNLEERSVHKSVYQQRTIWVPRQTASTYGHALEGIHQEIHKRAPNSNMQCAKSFTPLSVSISLEEGASSPMGLPRVGIFSYFVYSSGKYFSPLPKGSIHAMTGPSIKIKFVEWQLIFSLFFLDHMSCSNCPRKRSRETTYINGQNFRYQWQPSSVFPKYIHGWNWRK